jgi:DNA-binding protein HU-beta
MNKNKLIESIVDVLRENNVRKSIPAQKTTLHISDDQGNHSDFVVKKKTTGLLFTKEDITSVIDACIAVIEDSIKRGEEISIMGFGSLGVHKRLSRQGRHPVTGDVFSTGDKYVPKFSFGNNLRMAAKVYELSLMDHEVDKAVDEDGN